MASSESERIQRRKNIMIFTNLATTPSTKPHPKLSYDLYNMVREGEVEAGAEPTPFEAPGVYNLARELLRTLGLVLSYAATSNLGPTRSSRLYYLWFSSIAAAYQRVDDGHHIGGTHDDWNWDTRYMIRSEQDRCIWMLLVLEVIMTKLGISYTAPWSALADVYAITAAEGLDAAKSAASLAGNFLEWQASYTAWFAARAADGSVAAAVAPGDDVLPNGAPRLQVDATVDPAGFPHPESWTPLKLTAAATAQKYLTYNWNDVVSAAGLTAGDQSTVFAAANAFYPGVGSARDTEIGEVLTITNGLTDREKVIAEFWAGGPFTVSPPGMLLWMWKHYVGERDAATVVYSGLDLSLHLFETGRIVWGLKKAHMQARPIQEIRRLYRGVAVKKYDGTNILGESWVPYQETNFVTPPFADFPSGHSAFSRSFANVMNRWFGSTIRSTSVDMMDISLISPALVAQSGTFGTFVFGTGASQIQSGVVPAAPVVLSWSSWDEMAESAGVSRKYGGIHATSAHTGSVAAADTLHAVLSERFAINM